MRAVVYALCYDQLNICELAACELLLRRAQQVEIRWKERTLRNGPTLVGGEVTMWLSHLLMVTIHIQTT